MKKYTINDLKTFERYDFGFLICPSGDYTAIKEFEEGCEFGAGAKFGDTN